MKIAFVSPYPPQRDGIADYTAALAREMRSAGHEVAVLSTRPVAEGPDEVIGGLGAVARLRSFDPDVVHVQFGVAAFGTRVPALLALLRRVRVTRARLVVTAHEVTRDTALLRGPGRILYRRLARSADLVLVHTATALGELTRLIDSNDAVAVVPHHRRPPPPPITDAASLRERHGLADASVLLAFGFVHVDKGLDDLVGAMALLPRGAAHVVVAGDVRRRSGAFRAFELADRRHLARVRREVRRAGLDPWVHWTGYVPEGEIAPWFSAADAAVLPYRRIEQSGVGSLAAAMAVPVLASTAGSLVSDYGDARWSFPPADRERMAEVIRDFLATPRPADRKDGRTSGGADITEVAARTLEAYRTEVVGPERGTAVQPA